MTSPTSAGSKRPAFTLTELLVVIGIIALLIGVVLPMTLNARKKAEAVRIRSDLNTLSIALEAYRNDVHDYPRLSAANTGARCLYDAVATSFPLRGTTGTRCGPYVNLDRFKIDATNHKLLDSGNCPILYFPANPVRPNPLTAATTIATKSNYPPLSGDPLYNQNDNTDVKLGDMQSLLGIKGNAFTNGSGPNCTGPFILWSAGADGLFGYDADVRCDDVTNFDH